MITVPVLAVVALHVVAAGGYAFATVKAYEHGVGPGLAAGFGGVAITVTAEYIIGTQIVSMPRTEAYLMIALSAGAALLIASTIFVAVDPEPVESEDEDSDEDPLDKIARI